jgi:hypothetical protein
MSPVYDFDKDEELFSPIEFKIEGKVYKVRKITKKILDEFRKIEGDVIEQFAYFTKKKPEEVENIAFQILTQCIKLIFDSFKTPFTAEVQELTKLLKEKRELTKEPKEPKEPEPDKKKDSSPGLKNS